MDQILQGQSLTNGRWTHLQHKLFIHGLQLHGRNWKKIQQLIKTRTPTQVRSHAQKYFQKLKDAKKSSIQRGQLTKEEFQTQQKDQVQITNPKNTYSYLFGQVMTKIKFNENFNFFQELIDQNKSSNCLDPKFTELNKFSEFGKNQKNQSI